MRTLGARWSLGVCAVSAFGSLAACSYDFNQFAAHSNSDNGGGDTDQEGGGASNVGGGASGGSGGVSAGSGGSSGAGGAVADARADSSRDGSLDSGGGAGSAAGSGGTMDAGEDTSDDVSLEDAISDAPSQLTEAGFDCSSVAGSVFYGGHCYYVNNALTTWTVASTSGCAAPAHLVTITSAGEENAVANIIGVQDYWIGLSMPTGASKNKMESAFAWITGEPYDPNTSYRHWDLYSDSDIEPNFTGDCVRIRYTSFWADCPCTLSLGALCEHE